MLRRFFASELLFMADTGKDKGDCVLKRAFSEAIEAEQIRHKQAIVLFSTNAW